jgi:hypothetical protein
MTMILVLAMFIIFVAIDYVQSRKRGVQPAVKRETPRAPMHRWLPAFVAGCRDT